MNSISTALWTCPLPAGASGSPQFVQSGRLGTVMRNRPDSIPRPPTVLAKAVDPDEGSEISDDETSIVGMVHILDDDASLRRGLEGLMRSAGIPTRSYETPAQFMSAERSAAPSCLILDVRMPGVNGLDFQEQLAASGDALPIVVVTGHGDVPTSVRAMKAGAVDFLSKPFRESDMLAAVQAALDRSSRRLAYDAETARVERLYETLSPRERQIMRLVTSGLMNKQIAGDLGISEVTVKIHRKSAMRKTGAHSLADLVRMADTLGLHARASFRQEDLAEAASTTTGPVDERRRVID